MKWWVWAAVLLAAGCGGSSGGGGGSAGNQMFSCVAAFPGADGGVGMPAVCIDATGATAQELEMERQQCAQEGNTFATTLCPHQGALGGCRESISSSTIVLTTWYYADGNSTASDIQTLCQSLAGTGLPGVTIQFVTP